MFSGSGRNVEYRHGEIHRTPNRQFREATQLRHGHGTYIDEHGKRRYCKYRQPTGAGRNTRESLGYSANPELIDESPDHNEENTPTLDSAGETVLDEGDSSEVERWIAGVSHDATPMDTRDVPESDEAHQGAGDCGQGEEGDHEKVERPINRIRRKLSLKPDEGNYWARK